MYPRPQTRTPTLRFANAGSRSKSDFSLNGRPQPNKPEVTRPKMDARSKNSKSSGVKDESDPCRYFPEQPAHSLTGH